MGSVLLRNSSLDLVDGMIVGKGQSCALVVVLDAREGTPRRSPRAATTRQVPPAGSTRASSSSTPDIQGLLMDLLKEVGDLKKSVDALKKDMEKQHEVILKRIDELETEEVVVLETTHT